MSEMVTVREAMELHAMDLARRIWPPSPPDKGWAADGAPWFALQAEPQQETLAAAHLIGRRFDVYLPAVAVYAKRGRAMQWRTEPMFRGYLFLRMTLGRLAESVARVQTLPGVRGFVRMAGGDSTSALAAIRPDDMLRIRHDEAESFGHKRHGQYDGHLAPGAAVRVVDGPFAGFPGEVENIRDGDHVRVLVQIFGRATPVTVAAWALEAM